MNSTFRRLIAAVTVVLLMSQCRAQTQTEVRITLRDGSSFTGKARMGNVILVTDYGKLDIPVQNVTAIDFGIGTDKANEAKIINLIKQMANSDENLRKSAYEELTRMGAGAIPVISDFIYSEKYQSAGFSDYTPENALNELKSVLGIDESVSDMDIVTIDGQYTMGGKYDLKKLDLNTEYGALSLPKEKIKRLDVLYTPSGDGSDKNFILLGSKHISSNANGGWLKTGMVVKQGQRLTINASGEISFASLSNSKYKPDGKPAGDAMGEADYESGEYGDGASYPTYGNVVFKIGEHGTVNKAGARYSVTAQNTGVLYLSVYESVFNPNNTGSYSVHVTVH